MVVIHVLISYANNSHTNICKQLIELGNVTTKINYTPNIAENNMEYISRDKICNILNIEPTKMCNDISVTIKDYNNHYDTNTEAYYLASSKLIPMWEQQFGRYFDVIAKYNNNWIEKLRTLLQTNMQQKPDECILQNEIQSLIIYKEKYKKLKAALNQ